MNTDLAKKWLARILLISLVTIGVQAKALDIITATVTVTNTAGTTNGQTLTVNSDVRTWTNSVQVPGAQILTNSTIGGAVTNMFNQVANYPFASLNLGISGTNAITLQTAPGGPLSVALSAGWGTVVLTTNTLTDFTAAEVPLSAYPAAQQTNVASGITAMVGANQNTNAIPETAPAMTNFVGLTASQGVPGRKDHTNGFQQIWGALSTWAGLWMFSSASNSVPAINGVVAGVTNQLFATVSGWAMTTPLSASLVIGAGTISGVSVFINSSGIYGAGTGITNLMGTNITANTITQDQLATNGMRILGTNSFPAGSDIAFGRYALTSLATGNNAAIPVGTNSFVEVSGPGAAFTINGINGSPNRDGKFLIILNQTGFNMTIAHDSGTDPTAANRIISMTGADRTTTGNGAATLIYSAAANRWILISFDP